MNSSLAPLASSSSSSILSSATDRPTQVDRQVLRALFELALADRPADAGSVARLLGLRASEVGGIFVRLDALGLVRAERARLTLSGLATAARLEALPHAFGPRHTQEQPAKAMPSERETRPARGRRPVQQEIAAAPGRPGRRTIRTSPSSVSL